MQSRIISCFFVFLFPVESGREGKENEARIKLWTKKKKTVHNNKYLKGTNGISILQRFRTGADIIAILGLVVLRTIRSEVSPSAKQKTLPTLTSENLLQVITMTTSTPTLQSITASRITTQTMVRSKNETDPACKARRVVVGSNGG